MRTASPSDDQRVPVDRLPPAEADQAWRGLSQSFEALPSVEQSESILQVPDVDESVAEVGNGSLAHCLVASQWGTPVTAEYAVSLHCVARALAHLAAFE